MPKIISTATSDAPYILPQSEIKNFIYNLFSGSGLEIERLISVFDNSEITQRHISVKPEWLAKEHTFKEQSEIFTEVSLELAKQAIVECLAGVNINPAKIDNMIYVTSTGVMTPTLDARLFNELGFNSHIKRLPLWGLGCAGGAAGISRAMDLTKAYPKENVLVVAVELCSLTFQKDDISKSNIVAASLFGDGCACVLIAGDENELSANENCPELVASLSTIYDNSLDVMGWDIVDTGFSVVFSRDIPTIVKENVKPNIAELLSMHNMSIEDIKHYITHPGGLKVINAYEESLGLKQGTLNISHKILKEHGNMSSPSVIYVLDEFLKNVQSTKAGEYGLISSLGPGFSSELVLFKTS
ncbi:MAG TPA: 3-oxoacyl-[acyl-carrier-protein] synthase III C-terminal domain-containing protein [Ignavibacteria bacterium]|nr:3-oxoacyl-[acyl-carrier-protein] synthase III C-terminal domain-containing protein [Ignavibacteria bacterium]